MKTITKIMRFLHALIEQNDVLSMFNENYYPATLVLRVSTVPVNPSIIEREKRQMINREPNTDVMYTLMKF